MPHDGQGVLSLRMALTVSTSSGRQTCSSRVASTVPHSANEKALSAEKDYTVRLFQIAKLQGDANEVKIGCDKEGRKAIDEVGEKVEDLIKATLGVLHIPAVRTDRACVRAK